MRPAVEARKRAAQRPEGERRRQRLAVAIVGALVLIVTGILVTGYVIFFVFPHRQQAIRVNDVSYTRGDVVKILRLRQATTQASGGQFDPSEDVFVALQLIIENEIIAQTAPRLGISTTRQQIDDRIRSIMAPSEFESLGKDEAQIDREFRERYRNYLNTTQVSESEHRDLVRKAILREKVRQLIGDQVPVIAEQGHVHRIVMAQEDEVDIMQTKLQDAISDDKSPENIQAAFEAVFREFSRDTQTIRDKGDLGWLPLGVYEEYERSFFDLEVGELSTAVPNRDNRSQIIFFMVSERSGTRALDPASVDILKTGALQEWLNEERANHDIDSAFDSTNYAWMVEQLRISARVISTPAAGNVNPGP